MVELAVVVDEELVVGWEKGLDACGVGEGKGWEKNGGLVRYE